MENVMTFQPAIDCAEVIIDAVIDGKPVANVLNFHREGGYALSDLENLAGVIAYWVNDSYRPMCHTGVLFTTVRARGLTDAVDLSAFSLDGAGSGTAAGLPVASNVSVVCTLRTAHTGRSARGRFYALPTGQSFFTAVNTVTSGYTDALEALLGLFQVHALEGGWELVVLSRHHLGAPRAVAVPYTVATIVCRNNKTDSQRNRLPRPH
jgi:hypothetical protein